VQTRLAALDPLASEAPRSALSAYRKLEQKEHKPMSKKIIWRPAWTLLTILAVLAITFSFQPARALAGSFLNLFRVQQVTLLPMDMSALQGPSGEPTLGKAMAQLSSESMIVTREHEEPLEVETAGAASEAAGFAVRTWAGAADQPAIQVDQGMAFEFTVDLDQIRQVLADANVQGPELPSSLQGVKFSLDIPASAEISYGDCRYYGGYDENDPDDRAIVENSGCIHIMQMPSPTVQTDPEIDASQLAIIGLQYLGMSEEEALEYSNTIDWTTTLVIPIPRGQVESEAVSVDGVDAKLLFPLDEEGSRRPFGAMLIWIKDGILYAVSGAVDSQALLDIANNLQ
jgi:hypothetical protein